jgi:hypothetical protein
MIFRTGGIPMSTLYLIPNRAQDYALLAPLENWRREKRYCYRCGKWGGPPLVHHDCPKHGISTTWVNIITLHNYCDLCGVTGPIKETSYYCGCGNVQPTIYSDEVVSLSYGDTLLSTDGNFMYILRRSGVVVIGRRSYHNASYEMR